jgi:hypothetical protein
VADPINLNNSSPGSFAQPTQPLENALTPAEETPTTIITTSPLIVTPNALTSQPVGAGGGFTQEAAAVMGTTPEQGCCSGGGGGSGSGGGGGSGYTTIEDNSGVALPQRTTLKFAAGLNASDLGGITVGVLDTAHTNTWTALQTFDADLNTGAGIQGNWRLGGQLLGSDDASHNTTYIYQPTSANSDPFLWAYADAFHAQARYDQIATWGWNLTSGGARYNPAVRHGAMGISLEQYFEGSNFQMEGHWLYVDPADQQHRPITMLANLDAPYGINLMIGAPSFTLSGYDPGIGGTGGTIALDSTRVYLSAPTVNHHVTVTDSNVFLNATNGGASATLTLDPIGDLTLIGTRNVFGKVGGGQPQLQIQSGIIVAQDSTGNNFVAVDAAKVDIDASVASGLIRIGRNATTVLLGATTGPMNVEINSGATLRNDNTASETTTVGAAGGASAPPASPVKWLTIKLSDGNPYKIPVYNP